MESVTDIPMASPAHAPGMLSTPRAAAILLTKELRLEFRSREILTATVVFSLVVITFFSYVFEPTATESRRYGPGLLWIAFLFAGSLMLHPSFAREQNNDTLDALRMAPISPFAILLGKLLANFIFMSLTELVLVPVFAVFYNLSLAGIAGRLTLVLMLGTLGSRHHGHGFLRDLRARPDARAFAPAAAAPDPRAPADRGRRGHGVAFSPSSPRSTAPGSLFSLDLILCSLALPGCCAIFWSRNERGHGRHERKRKGGQP